MAAPEAMPQPALTEYLGSKTGEEVVPVATPTRRRVNCSVKAMAEAFYRPVYGYERMIDDALAFQAGEDIGVIPTWVHECAGFRRGTLQPMHCAEVAT